jgi:hypothetical protein
MTEYAATLLPSAHIEGVIRFLLAGARGDGWIPDRVEYDGTPVYAAGDKSSSVGLANLDTGPYMVLTVSELLNRSDITNGASLFSEWERALKQSLDILPLSSSGLVWNDPVNPHSTYGFTDTIAKTGELFMESLLLYNALRAMEKLSRRFNGTNTMIYTVQMEKIKKNIGVLYDEKSGMFLAASKDCGQIDIWANAYMLYSGFLCDTKKAERAAAWLSENTENYLYEGQVRHLLKNQYWERLLIDVSPETYQNGAYWATASGWVIWCLAQMKPVLAAEEFAGALRYCLHNGFFECINVNYQKLNNFVVSGTNLLGCATRLLKEKNQMFLDKMESLCGDL